MDRPQPSNIEAERGILGTILNNNQAIDIAQEIVTADDFYDSKHNLIYRAMIYLNNKKTALDMVTLKEALKNKINEVGGVTYLADLTGSYFATSNIKEYSLIVKDKSNKRKIIRTANEMLLQAYDEVVATEKILNESQDKILNINNYKSSDIFSAADVAMRAYEVIERNYNNGGGLTGLSTGLTSLDEKLGGLGPGDYAIVAARPSMGKTAFMLTLTQNVAKEKKTVMLFSLEMTKEKLMNRLFANITKIPLSRIRTGELKPDEWTILAQCANTVSGEKIFFDDKPGLSLSEIKTKAKKVKLEHGLDLIVLDYIGLVNLNGKIENRTQELAKISAGLKGLGKELGVPIVVLSQLSRGPEARSDHRPMLSDLRESGAIEQDADVAMLLYRDEYYNPETEDKNILEAIIGKSRDGETGTVKLFWDGATQTIGDLDVIHQGTYNPEMFKGGK